MASCILSHIIGLEGDIDFEDSLLDKVGKALVWRILVVPELLWFIISNIVQNKVKEMKT